MSQNLDINSSYIIFGAMKFQNSNLSHIARKLHACNLSQKVLAEKAVPGLNKVVVFLFS